MLKDVTNLKKGEVEANYDFKIHNTEMFFRSISFSYSFIEIRYFLALKWNLGIFVVVDITSKVKLTPNV